jgi:hypothetical protein
MSFRLKYAYAQFNLDDWMPRGTFVRLGMQQTPFIDSLESVYRYRFQGTPFTERAGYMSSADTGITFRTAFPGNYGDVHVGIYNGEGYSRTEANDQKSFQARVGVRPLPMHALMKGWRVQGFYTADHVVRNAERTRAVLNTTFEGTNVNAGFDYIRATDRPSAAQRAVEGGGWSVWATPKLPNVEDGSSWEALLRYDHGTADDFTDAGSRRTIAGVAYWFPRKGSGSAALLLDFEHVRHVDFVPPRLTERRFFLHMLVNF